jgi:hypothetical protein
MNRRLHFRDIPPRSAKEGQIQRLIQATESCNLLAGIAVLGVGLLVCVTRSQKHSTEADRAAPQPEADNREYDGCTKTETEDEDILLRKKRVTELEPEAAGKDQEK